MQKGGLSTLRDAGRRDSTYKWFSCRQQQLDHSIEGGKNLPVTAATLTLSSRQLLISMLAETPRWWSAIGAEVEGSHGLGNAWENRSVGKLSATKVNAQYTERIVDSKRK